MAEGRPVHSRGHSSYANVYESPSFVKKERTMGASVNLPFVYPSIGASLAPVGCFEVALAAPSGIRAQGPVSIRARQHQHGITVAGGRSFQSFLRGSLRILRSCRTDSYRQFAGGCFHLMIQSTDPAVAHGFGCRICEVCCPAA